MVIDMKDMAKLELFFQTLADANRLRIIKAIGQERLSVSEIVGATGLSQPLVSHHLRVMREQGLLETQRQGPFIYHRIKEARLLDVLGFCAEIAAQTQNDKKIRRTFCCPPWMNKDNRY
jgi:DNA-binding transcriptional ArsR family regulator